MQLVSRADLAQQAHKVHRVRKETWVQQVHLEDKEIQEELEPQEVRVLLETQDQRVRVVHKVIIRYELNGKNLSVIFVTTRIIKSLCYA